jgi:hypothetical protein
MSVLIQGAGSQQLARVCLVVQHMELAKKIRVHLLWSSSTRARVALKASGNDEVE